MGENIELLDLTTKTLDLFEIKSINDLKDTLFNVVINHDYEKMRDFKKLIGNDLKSDWLQKIYQYYLADRKNKTQDYTPASLAKLMGSIALTESDEIIDMCAGSGALTIQMWAINPNIKATCLEFDENVIPILLFNLSIRNINAKVYQTDVLQKETLSVFEIKPTNEFGEVSKLDANID